MAALAAPAAAAAQPARTPLQVLKTNGRYFAQGSKVVYLTGSHTWTNLIDDLGGCSHGEGRFDYSAYLNWLRRHNHNFIRLWAQELTRFDDQCGVAIRTTPHPWSRTGPGNALGGLPKFDLNRFNERYFSRLRNRVRLAAAAGIYVSIMLFNGWDLQFAGSWKWRGHPFNAENNVNGIDGDVDGDGVGTEIHTLRNKAVLAVEEAYVRKVVDTVNGFDNVLYEIANEAGAYSTQWQYHMIELIKRYEATKPKQHPVGMTFQHPDGSNAALFASPADWISPRDTTTKLNLRRAGGLSVAVFIVGGGLALVLRRQRTRLALLVALGAASVIAIAWILPGRLRLEQPEFVYLDDPPVASGAKVVLSDTDHHCGVCGDASFVWRNFLRGNNPIFMDPLDRNPTHEAARLAMGDTLRFSKRINLGELEPRPDLASTRYVLARRGSEYLVYQPESGTFSVKLALARYAAAWFDPRRHISLRPFIIAASGSTTFTPPFRGPAVLHLRAKHS